METDKSGQTRVITALLDLYQDSLGQFRTRGQGQSNSAEIRIKTIVNKVGGKKNIHY